MGVLVCDVGPRDGLQNEPETLAPAARAQLVNRLAEAGVRRIEAVSFVRDDRVPQMAGAEEVVAAIERRDGVDYAGLVLNEHGFERFRRMALDRVNLTLGATESFNQRNGNASLAAATARVQRILAARETPATATISAAFGCPFEGDVEPEAVVALARELDADELVLADTIGVATPSAVRALTERVLELGKPVGFHGHNTRNTGYANALAALDAGAMVLDASAGGLGGCPYAPRASGNIATEDLVYLLEREGIDTGIDLGGLVRVSEWLEGVLGHQLEGQVYRAGVATVSAPLTGIPVTGVNELVLEVLDLGAAEQFYAGVLGFPVVGRRENDRIWLMAGTRTRIGLWAPQVGIASGRGGVHVHYAMHIDAGDYDAAVARLRDHGYDPHEEDFGETGRAAYVSDPDGNVVELWTWDVAGHLS